MENENNVSIITNERDYTKAVTGGSFNVFKAVKISKFNILKRRAAKAAKKAEKLLKQSEAYAAERDATKKNVDDNFLFNVFNNKSKEKRQQSEKYAEKAMIANTNATLVEADLKVLYQNEASKPIRLRQGIKNIAGKWNNWLKNKIVKSKAVDVPVNDNIEINNTAKVENVAKIRRPAVEVAPIRNEEKMQSMANIIDDNFFKTKEELNEKGTGKYNSNATITDGDLKFESIESRQKPLPSAYTIKVPQEDAESKLKNNNDLVYGTENKKKKSEKSWIDIGNEELNEKFDITFNTKIKNSVSPVNADNIRETDGLKGEKTRVGTTPKAQKESQEKSSTFSLQQQKEMLEAIRKARENQDRKKEELEAVRKAKENEDKKKELAMKKLQEAIEKADKDIADRLAAETAELQKEKEKSAQDIADAQKEINQEIADMYKSFGYEVPEEFLSSGKTK